MQTLKLADDLFPKLLDGSKRGTIRLGKRDIEPGPLVYDAVSAGIRVPVEVCRVSYTTVARLTPDDAALDGYKSIKELYDALRRFYPSLAGSDVVTVVEHSGPAT